MASCSTSQWSGSYTPQVTLTVTQQSSTDTQVVLAWTLKYVTHGYTADTNGNGRDYTVTIDGDSVKTGTFDINGKSTTTIASGTKTVDKSTSARNVSFSCSFDFELTWSDVYSGSSPKTASSSISISAKTSYTVSYNANGGSGAPSAQTKWHGTTLTLSNTKPTRTGYTFNGWALSQADANSGDSYYQAGGSCGKNENLTLYAVWAENKLTINYYSNYADSGTYKGEELSVSASTNVLVLSQDFYYDNEYSNGLADIQNTSALYLFRTGYTSTGYWGTSTSGGTLVHQKTSYSSGQALAQALGKTLVNGNVSINIYPQWQINTYTINYNPNGGSGSMSAQSVKWKDDFILSNNTFKREGYKFVGWNAYRNSDDTWYVSGQGWITNNEIIAGGYQKKLYGNQYEMTFNASWIKGNEKVVNQYTFYAVWEISGVVYIDNGTTFEPYLAYIDNGSSWEPYFVYIDNGSDWNIIS